MCRLDLLHLKLQKIQLLGPAAGIGRGVRPLPLRLHVFPMQPAALYESVSELCTCKIIENTEMVFLVEQ